MNIGDYLIWRGDIPVTVSPFNAVDALVLSHVIYSHFYGVGDGAGSLFRDAGPEAERHFPDELPRTVVASPDEVMLAAAATRRFGDCILCEYADEIDEDEEKQFAAAVCSGDAKTLAKSKGLGKRTVLFGHCLRNILPSYISLMAISLPHILGGTYIIETVFSYPGIGTLSYESARYHDYNMLMVLCMMTGALVILGNLIGQIINERIDPRVRGNEAPIPEVDER